MPRLPRHLASWVCKCFTTPGGELPTTISLSYKPWNWIGRRVSIFMCQVSFCSSRHFVRMVFEVEHNWLTLLLAQSHFICIVPIIQAKHPPYPTLYRGQTEPNKDIKSSNNKHIHVSTFLLWCSPTSVLSLLKVSVFTLQNKTLSRQDQIRKLFTNDQEKYTFISLN